MEPDTSRQVSLESSSSLSEEVVGEIVEHVRVQGTASAVSVMGRLGIDPSHRDVVESVVGSVREE